MKIESTPVLIAAIESLIQRHQEDLEQLYAIRQFSLQISSSRRVAMRTELESTSIDLPQLIPETFSLVHGGKQCYLGNTYLYTLMDLLVKKSNQFVSHELLLDQVWCSVRSDSTVRSLVRSLRDKLKSAGMVDLSNRIGSIKGHYILNF